MYHSRTNMGQKDIFSVCNTAYGTVKHVFCIGTVRKHALLDCPRVIYKFFAANAACYFSEFIRCCQSYLRFKRNFILHTAIKHVKMKNCLFYFRIFRCTMPVCYICFSLFWAVIVFLAFLLYFLNIGYV